MGLIASSSVGLLSSLIQCLVVLSEIVSAETDRLQKKYICSSDQAILLAYFQSAVTVRCTLGVVKHDKYIDLTTAAVYLFRSKEIGRQGNKFVW